MPRHAKAWKFKRQNRFAAFKPGHDNAMFEWWLCLRYGLYVRGRSSLIRRQKRRFSVLVISNLQWTKLLLSRFDSIPINMTSAKQLQLSCTDAILKAEKGFFFRNTIIIKAARPLFLTLYL